MERDKVVGAANWIFVLADPQFYDLIVQGCVQMGHVLELLCALKIAHLRREDKAVQYSTSFKDLLKRKAARFQCGKRFHAFLRRHGRGPVQLFVYLGAVEFLQIFEFQV